MKLDLTAKEIKSIGQHRAMSALDRKYMPWMCSGVVLVFAGLFTLLADNTIGGPLVVLGFTATLFVLFSEFWEAHLEGYKFLDSVIKGDTQVDTKQ